MAVLVAGSCVGLRLRAWATGPPVSPVWHRVPGVELARAFSASGAVSTPAEETTIATFWKERGSVKAARARRRRQRTRAALEAMQAVRQRDQHCRFPLCGCNQFRLRLEVSHQRHRGMAGNPRGDRSVPALMILVCAARHRENRIALDRGTLRWRALTDRGADGPIAWDIDMTRIFVPTAFMIGDRLATPGDCWREVARETAPHRYSRLNGRQREVLASLATMQY